MVLSTSTIFFFVHGEGWGGGDLVVSCHVGPVSGRVGVSKKRRGNLTFTVKLFLLFIVRRQIILSTTFLTTFVQCISIYWNLGRVMVGEQPGARGRVVGHANISSTRVEDGGRYQCIASNKAGRASHSANLNIYGNFDMTVFIWNSLFSLKLKTLTINASNSMCCLNY